MCWNLSASLIITLIGLIAVGYLILKKHSYELWIPVGYFALMEFLQALSYLYINNCSLPANQMLTYLSYLHICFQPFFVNMLTMYFIPKQVKEKISGYVYAVCFAGTILSLIRVYPFEWAGLCTPGVEYLCGTNLCSMQGAWHIAWFVPLNGIGGLLNFAYIIPAFILPLVYGSWKTTIYQLAIGPFLASYLTNSRNEMPAVWCLLSIAFILVAIFTKLRKLLQVKKWYFWKYPFN
jgi:hypothetical protein